MPETIWSLPSKCHDVITVSSNKLTKQDLRWARLNETRMKMTSQKQLFPSFATTISAFGILLYCIGFLRIELELNNHKKRLNALENNRETKPPSSDPNIVEIIMKRTFNRILRWLILHTYPVFWSQLASDWVVLGGGAEVLPYITYTGMCRPTGSWL